jgi:crotonobetainyl-CoA:carnitine CoA-transferase CaiB-like acyl-CoA transferase
MNAESTAGPLAGIRVIELGQVIAGPFCGQLLGDLGADVIKVEPPGTGDVLRQWGGGDAPGGSVWWQVAGRNKRSITIDLRQEQGQSLVRDLAAEADILIENFRPGTLERWGLGWETLHAANPGLIVVRVSGYGQTGPFSPLPGYAAVGEAMGGLRSLVGYPDRPPVRLGVSLGDSLAGMFAALGALAALESRRSTGQGQVVDSSIYESVLGITESLVADWSALGVRRERTGPILPKIAPSNVYPAADGEVIVAANQDSVFVRLCAAMGRPELAEDPRFRDHRARGEHQAELDGIVGEWTARLPADELLRVLREAAVPSGLLYGPDDMLADEHYRSRESIVDVDTDGYGTVTMQGVFPRMSGTPGRVRWPGRALGADTDEVLRDVLHLPPETVSRLRDAGVI